MRDISVPSFALYKHSKVVRVRSSAHMEGDAGAPVVALHPVAVLFMTASRRHGRNILVRVLT